jgi:hypothetical protein
VLGIILVGIPVFYLTVGRTPRTGVPRAAAADGEG